MPVESHIGYEIRDAIALVTLRRPEKANAMTARMAADLHELCRRADADDAVRVVVLTGEGKTFCAGSDITTLDDYPTPWAFRNRLDYCDAILGLRKPAVAAVNGAAFGGGLELAISCDVVVASTAARFAAPEVKLGWVGGGGASQLLPRICGLANASLMLLTGDPVERAGGAAHRDRAEGRRPGCPPPGGIRDRAVDRRKRPDRDAGGEGGRAGVALVGPRCGHAYEEELVAICMGSEDRDEGIAAFAEKRPPDFRGR